MRFKRLQCLAVMVFACAVSTVRAIPVTVDFDDLDASAGDVPITTPYGALTFGNFTAYTTTPGFEGFNNGIVSGPNAAYSGGELFGPGVVPVVGSVDSNKRFDFEGGDFGAGYYDGLSLTVRGLRGGAIVYTRTLTLVGSGARSFDFAFLDIDSLTFVAAATTQSVDLFACGSFNCTQFTVDDLRFDVSDVTTPPTDVPEPASMALVLIGGLALTGSRLRHRRARG